MQLDVLIVDDSKGIRDRIKRALAKMPVVRTVHEAENGRIALELNKEKTPEVIILDIHMPEMNGIKVLKYIRKKGSSPVVIILTNFPLEKYKENCMKAGADYFLDKGLEFQKIPKIIKTLAGGRS